VLISPNNGREKRLI